MAILTLGDFVTAVQNRSKTGVVYTVSPQPVGTVGGAFFDSAQWHVDRNVHLAGRAGGEGPGWVRQRTRFRPESCSSSSTPDFVSVKADAQQFVNSLN